MKRGIAHKNEREQWIELLRIISMFWIIAFHFSDHGTIDMVTTPLCLNWVILAFFRWGDRELPICFNFGVSSL